MMDAILCVAKAIMCVVKAWVAGIRGLPGDAERHALD